MVDTVSWGEFSGRFDWRQGEHVTAIGPTGSGKTVLVKEILKVREAREGAVCVMASKPVDPRLSELQRRGYVRMREWTPQGTGPAGVVLTWREAARRMWDRLTGQPRASDPEIDRILLWPPFRGLGDLDTQRRVFEAAFSAMFTQGRWCIYLDELRWFRDHLDLEDWPRVIWMQGRSLKVSLVTSTQRPRWVPLEAFSMATHLFLWRANDEEDLRRIGGLGGINAAEVREIVAGLDWHDTLYVNTRDATMMVTRAPLAA